MNREKAWEMLNEHLHNKNLIKHCLAVEACMSELAVRFGVDSQQWGLAGLIHDLDYEYTVTTPEQHTLKTEEMLSGFDMGKDILHAVKSHNLRVQPASKMDWALYSVDPATGFIIACALMHPDKKLASVDLTFMKKRFKEKSFAKGASRDQILECGKLDIALDDFLVVCLAAMQKIAGDLGL